MVYLKDIKFLNKATTTKSMYFWARKYNADTREWEALQIRVSDHDSFGNFYNKNSELGAKLHDKLEIYLEPQEGIDIIFIGRKPTKATVTKILKTTYQLN